MSPQPKLSLLIKKELPGFSSASAIEFHNGRLYVTGDDSRHLLVLDKQYTLIDSVVLFPGDGLRIPKKTKTDLEASTIVHYSGKEYLLVAGSASTPEREVFFLFPLDNPGKYERIDARAFFDDLKKLGLETINIEGLTVVGNLLVFANRANLSQPDTHFISVPSTFLGDTSGIPLPMLLSTLKLPAERDSVKGISGLAFIPSKDLLLFTASVELTPNAIDDGGIGNSYFGYVSGFSSKLGQGEIIPDTLINLSAMQAEFRHEKIESVCVESVGKDLVFHLVADNDNGTSTLFKMSMPTPSR